VRASAIRLDWPHGQRFVLHAAGRSQTVQTRLIGRHFIYAVLAAVGAGLAAGRRLDDVLAGLTALLPTRGRLQPVPLPNGATLLRDEFKATPQTVEAALDVLSEIPAARRFVILGELDNLPSLPPEPHYVAVGRRVAQVADVVLVVGQRCDDYRRGLRAAGSDDARLWPCADVAAATTRLRRALRRGDVALLKGTDDDALTRIALALQGRAVRCAVRRCDLHDLFCDDCPLLARPARRAAAP
jgi:UDP-N-acetylmuramoyl-tripeptide--D-alanyl-D-alanine ligase